MLAKLPQVIRFERHAFGPYPFAAAGSIVDLEPKLGYALETQTRPIYAFVPDLTTLVHETAHQWFGDSVGSSAGPTSGSTRASRPGRSGTTPSATTAAAPARSSTGSTASRPPTPSSGNRRRVIPGKPKNLFSTSTYVRGAMALEALRVRIGTPDFLRLLRAWAREHRHGSADIGQFVALAEEVSGRDLGRLFHQWLFARGKPRGYGSI